MDEILVDGVLVKITNPEKILWPSQGIRKIDYIMTLMTLGSYMLPHGHNRLLTSIRYPDGVNGKSFFQKNTPSYAPEWLTRSEWQGNHYALLNSRAALLWLGNQAVIEFHTSFDRVDQMEYPTSLVFDLDPSEGQPFEDVAEVALRIRETLLSLNIDCWVKTSGATGLQIYIPVGNRYDYDAARRMNEFFGRYFSKKYPEKITIERLVRKRGTKLYFDYLQMWRGKTITMAYSPRATPFATISMPVEWAEISKGIKPEDFTLINAKKRLEAKGDLFKNLLDPAMEQNLDEILQFAE